MSTVLRARAAYSSYSLYCIITGESPVCCSSTSCRRRRSCSALSSPGRAAPPAAPPCAQRAPAARHPPTSTTSTSVAPVASACWSPQPCAPGRAAAPPAASGAPLRRSSHTPWPAARPGDSRHSSRRVVHNTQTHGHKAGHSPVPLPAAPGAAPVCAAPALTKWPFHSCSTSLCPQQAEDQYGGAAPAARR